MKLHNPNSSVVKINKVDKSTGRKINLVLNPGDTIDIDLKTRQVIAPMILFFKLQIHVEDIPNQPNTPPGQTTGSTDLAREGSTKRITVKQEELAKRQAKKDATDLHKKIPRSEERPAVETEDGKTLVAGDVHLDDEPSNEAMEELLFTKSVEEARQTESSEGTKEFEDTISTGPIDTTEWPEGEDESYARMVQESRIPDADLDATVTTLPAEEEGEEDDARSLADVLFGESGEDDFVNPLQKELAKQAELDDDTSDFDAIKDIWDISGITNETPKSDVPDECPYTKQQLSSMVKAKLWELANGLGVDAGGTKRDLVERIIGFYENR